MVAGFTTEEPRLRALSRDKAVTNWAYPGDAGD